MDRDSFGMLLQRFRRAAGLTQEELADRAGISARTVSDLERGLSRVPYKGTVNLLCAALDLDEDDAATLRGSVDRRRGVPLQQEDHTLQISPLPSELTPLVGREREAEGIVHLVRWKGVRLLTITGPGGVGKTRLALHLADRLAPDFGGDVVLVPLASLRDPDLVLPTILRTCGGRPEGTEPPGESLLRLLRRRRLLLLLDNFEQVRAAGVSLTQILSCPDVAVLVTSRERLGVRGEQEFPLSPLPLPDLQHLPTRDRLVDFPTVKLFLRTAQALRPDLQLDDSSAAIVAEICVRLDGLPLAIELAAAWMRVLTPQALLMRLDRRLQMLEGGPQDLPLRQQTMRNTIAWSYDLLSPEQQRFFRRVAVFRGGCDLPAVAAVCGEDGEDEWTALQAMTGLADKHLMQIDSNAQPEPRFTMLETIREYAREQLDLAGEGDVIRRRHRDWFFALAQEADGHLAGRDQQLWLDRLEREHDNMRSALAWSAQAGETEAGLRLANGLARFWQVRGSLAEGSRWYDLMLSTHPDDVSETLATALNSSGNIENLRRAYAKAANRYQQSLQNFRRLDLPARAATVVNNLAVLYDWHGDAARAIELYSEALEVYRALHDEEGVAQTLMNMAPLLGQQQRYDEAEQMMEEAIAVYRSLEDTRLVAGCLTNLGMIHLYRGAPQQAMARVREALDLFLTIGDKVGIIEAFEGMSYALTAQGHFLPATRLLAAADALRAQVGTPAPESERPSIEDACSRQRQGLGEAAFSTTWQEGHEMPLEAAIHEAQHQVATIGRRSDTA